MCMCVCVCVCVLYDIRMFIRIASVFSISQLFLQQANKDQCSPEQSVNRKTCDLTIKWTRQRTSIFSPSIKTTTNGKKTGAS